LTYTEELRDGRSSASINISSFPRVRRDSSKITSDQEPSLNTSPLSSDATHKSTNASPPLMVSCEPPWEKSFQPVLSSSFNENIIGSSAAPWEAIDMDWSGLDTGFLEGDQQTSENLKLANADSFFSLSSREPLSAGCHLGGHLGEPFLGGHPSFNDHLSPLPHSAASYRSTLLLRSAAGGTSTLDICKQTSDSLKADETSPQAIEADIESDEADLESDEANIEFDEGNLKTDEVYFEGEEDVDLDISLYLASSSPRKKDFEQGIQTLDEPGTDQATVVTEGSEEVASQARGDISANSSLEMTLPLFEDDTVCSDLPAMSEHFSTIQEQLCVVQEKLMSSHLPF